MDFIYQNNAVYGVLRRSSLLWIAAILVNSCIIRSEAKHLFFELHRRDCRWRPVGSSCRPVNDRCVQSGLSAFDEKIGDFMCQVFGDAYYTQQCVGDPNLFFPEEPSFHKGILLCNLVKLLIVCLNFIGIWVWWIIFYYDFLFPIWSLVCP